jgi:hypothetical protein
MLVAGALEACSLGLDPSWFFPRIVDGCAILGARNFHEIEAMAEHVLVQSVWLEEVMAPRMTVMMAKLHKFMECPTAIEITHPVLGNHCKC